MICWYCWRRSWKCNGVSVNETFVGIVENREVLTVPNRIRNSEGIRWQGKSVLDAEERHHHHALFSSVLHNKNWTLVALAIRAPETRSFSSFCIRRDPSLASAFADYTVTPKKTENVTLYIYEPPYSTIPTIPSTSYLPCWTCSTRQLAI